MSELEWERIIVLEGAAGQAILLGKQHEQKWFFKKEQDTLLREHSAITEHFNEGLLLLGQSWSFLTPVYVHPQFKAKLWTEVKQTRSLTQLTNWRMACI